MTDDEFLSLVPGTTIYHRELDGYEATVETAPGHRPRKLWSILGKPKLSDMCVQIMTCKRRRQLIYGGAPTREWCLNLEETEDGLRRAQAARSSAQRRKKRKRSGLSVNPYSKPRDWPNENARLDPITTLIIGFAYASRENTVSSPKRKQKLALSGSASSIVNGIPRGDSKRSSLPAIAR